MGRKTLLTVDDDPVVLAAISEVFSGDYNVLTARDGHEAIEIANQHRIDIILLDIMMPGFDGMDVVEEIDKRSPNSAMVMISGSPSVGRATEAMKRGAMSPQMM